MKCKYKGLITLLFVSGLPILAAAQQTSNGVTMAGMMRSNGKIYVVVAVLVIIFIGILLFLISLEKHLKRLEKKAE